MLGLKIEIALDGVPTFQISFSKKFLELSQRVIVPGTETVTTWLANQKQQDSSSHPFHCLKNWVDLDDFQAIAQISKNCFIINMPYPISGLAKILVKNASYRFGRKKWRGRNSRKDRIQVLDFSVLQT